MDKTRAKNSGEDVKMKVKELMVQLAQTNPENEVRLISNGNKDYTENLYLSFDDKGDVVIYESPENE